MPAPKANVTGKFTGSYASIGRNFRAQGQVYNGIGRATENLFNSMLQAADTYIKEKSKETPEERLFKLEKEREINSLVATDGATFRYDPDGFSEQSQKSKANFLEDIPEDQWDWANETYEKTINRYHSVVTSNKTMLNRQKQLEAFNKAGEEYKNQALTAAANGDLKTFAEASVKWRENEEYMFNNGFLDGNVKVRRAKEFTNIGVLQQNLFAAKQLFGNDEQLSAFIKNVDSSKNYTPEQKHSIKNTILSEYNSWHALNKVQAADTIKAADFGIQAYSMGIEPAGFDFDKTLANLKASGQNEKAAQLESAFNIKEEMRSFSQLSVGQMNEELKRLKKTASDKEDLSRIKILSQLAVTAEKDISDDPLDYAERHGIIQNDELDLTKPEKFSNRLKNAAFLQQKYQLDYMPIVKKSETEALKKAISNMGTEEKAGTLALLNNAFGENANQIFETVSPDNPEFAVAGKIFQRDPQTAINIIAGTEIAANEKGFAPTQNIALHNAFGRLDQALSNFSPEDVGKIKKAVVANMTYLNKKNNLFADGDAIDIDKTETADEAIENVLGGKIVRMSVGDKWFGDRYYTVLPGNTDQNDFEEWFKNLKDEDIKEAFVDGKRIRAQSIFNTGILNYDDNNRYTVTVNGELIRHADGTPLYLKYEAKK